MTDEECIAMAMLHGAIFYDWLPTSGHHSYTVCTEWEWQHTPSCDVEFGTREIAARKYCERHNLLWPTEPLNQVVDLRALTPAPNPQR